MECILTKLLFSQYQAELPINENAANTEKPLDIPKELWMMVDHLFRNAVKQVREIDGFIVLV